MRQIRYVIDTICEDFVQGWALGPSGRCEIDVIVDGRCVGRATTGLSRVDVAAALPDAPDSEAAGFLYVFADGDLGARTRDRDASVRLRITAGGLALETEPTLLPVFDSSILASNGSDRGTLPRSPFPQSVTELVIRVRPDLVDGDLCSETGALAAVEAIEHAVKRGPRPLAGVHRYLGYLRAVNGAAHFAAQYFPKGNALARGDKDRGAVLTGPDELVAIAQHFYVLTEAGVEGPLLEFGCYKGFSTSVLSTACHLLGRRMEVFDSFEGLPSSPSDYYRAGEFAGGLAEVTRNVTAFGQPEPVTFHAGFFSDSVPRWTRKPVACLWMDVDLEQSAADALAVFPDLDTRGALFSHECQPETFDRGRPVVHRGPDNVLGPIVDAFAAAGRDPVGFFVSGCTGAFWDARRGLPVLPTKAFDRILRLALA